MYRKLERASAILRAERLPLRARVQLVRAALIRRLRPSRAVRISLGPGSVLLGGSNTVFDYTAFFEIFVRRQYDAAFAGAAVLDIGAHRGYFSAYALLAGATTVWSFEPERENYAILTQAQRDFRCANYDWRVERVAISGTEGVADLHVTGRSWSHSLFDRPDVGVIATERVALRSMASVLDEVERQRPETVIVKVDIEGAECSLVLDTPPERWRPVDELFVEFESRGGCTVGELITHLAAGGLMHCGTRGSVLRFARRPSTSQWPT